MIDGQPSDTAHQVAAARAAHLRFDPTPHLLEDVHAADLLGPDAIALVDGYGNDGPWIPVENRLFIPLRARYVEDQLSEGYAQKPTVEAALRDLFSKRSPESEVVFDIMRPWDELPERDGEIRAALNQYLSGADEPHINHYTRQEIIQTARESGFPDVLVESREAIVRRYLEPLEIEIPLSQRFRLIVARVP